MGFSSMTMASGRLAACSELPAAKQLVAESGAETCGLLKERGLTAR